jgi:glycosyltransferase involved in cell wall biosynthesis
VIRSSINTGVVKTFERAINNATGDIIFLSDQDDVWLPNKVEKILEVFQEYPDITLVLSDAQIIDSEGQITADSFFKIRGKFVADPLSNFIKSKYHGCTLAFRREMLEVFLPFPADIPMHDIWIGIVNGIYGKAFYIDEPLIQHRRHSSNTGRGMFNHAGIIKMLKWRFALAKNILALLLKHGNRKIKA